MVPGLCLRQVRERLGLTYRDVERSSLELAAQRGLTVKEWKVDRERWQLRAEDLQPLLGKAVTLASYEVVIGLMIGGAVLAGVVYRMWHDRIVFWV